MLDHHALADEIGQRIADQAAAALQRRQARAALRAVLAERRKHGKAKHHSQRLAEAKQEKNVSQPSADAPGAAPVPRMARTARTRTTEPVEDVPDRRRGRQAGYPHRDEWHAANKALARGLSRLARDPDPVARQAGADIAAAVADLVGQAAILAEASSGRSQRAAADVARKLPELARQIDTLKVQLGRRGVALSGPQDVRNP